MTVYLHATAMVYTKEQLKLYFDRIKYLESRHAADPHTFLLELQKYQLNKVPFESLSLHYSADKKVSLEPQALFSKIVLNKRGGYCLENNRFFAEILRSLGFSVVHIICRISNATRGIMDGGWRAMYNLVYRSVVSLIAN
jgi:arylamine N-acetyltransferase